MLRLDNLVKNTKWENVSPSVTLRLTTKLNSRTNRLDPLCFSYCLYCCVSPADKSAQDPFARHDGSSTTDPCGRLDIFHFLDIRNSKNISPPLPACLQEQAGHRIAMQERRRLLWRDILHNSDTDWRWPQPLIRSIEVRCLPSS